MYIPKRYGESKKQACPFCGKQAVTQNKQGVPVCVKHKSEYLDLKCICGDWLDVKSGKWGPYCTCVRCGNISWSKAMEANPNITEGSSSGTEKRQKQVPAKKPYRPIRETKKEVVLTSDELDLM